MTINRFLINNKIKCISLSYVCNQLKKPILDFSTFPISFIDGVCNLLVGFVRYNTEIPGSIPGRVNVDNVQKELVFNAGSSLGVLRSALVINLVNVNHTTSIMLLFFWNIRCFCCVPNITPIYCVLNIVLFIVTKVECYVYVKC